jgi:flagellar hook-associated protein 2
MVGYYNQVIRDINIYTRNEPALIDQIEYFDEAERELMESRLGIFQGDSSLNQLRTRMQTIMMNAYDTGGRDSYALLAQIGVSTNASGAGGGVDSARLRGYLEINESQLDEALNRDFEAVGRLFGQDTDGDLAVDRGVAVALEQFVSPYVRTGGIVASRTDSLSTQINQTEDRISRYNDRLEDYETAAPPRLWPDGGDAAAAGGELDGPRSSQHPVKPEQLSDRGRRRPGKA